MWKKRLLRISKWFFGIILSLVLLITAILYFFKDEICDMVIAEVNQYLKTEVSVSEVDLAFWGSFPNLSVDFKDVFIKDAYEGATVHDTLLYSQRIRLKFNPMDIWRENYTLKSVEISPGTLNLKVNEAGLQNYDILKERPDEKEKTGVDVNLEAIELENFRVSYANQVTHQVYRTSLADMSLTGELSSTVFTTTASSNLRILEVRSGNVTLIKNQPAVLNISVNVNNELSTVDIPLSTIYISELPFSFKGEMDSVGYSFNVTGEKIQIADAANRFSTKETADVKKFEGHGSLLFNLDVHGKNQSNSPALIHCKFGVNGGRLKDPNTGLSLQKIALDGEYSNEQGKAKEFLHLRDISFQTKGGPFKGDLKITQFNTPRFQGNADGSLDLSIIHSLFQIPKVQVMNGMLGMHSDFVVVSLPNEDQTVNYSIEKCEGQLDLKDVNFQLVEDKRVFSKINGQVYLRNNEAGMNAISLRIRKSDFAVNGVFKDIIGYFDGSGKLNADVEIKSNHIRIEDLGAEEKADKVEQERVFMLPERIIGNVYLDVNRLDYESHLFQALKGNMTINERVIHFPKIAVRNGGADIRGTLTIEERSPEYFYLSSQLVSKNISFKSLFKEWNNFNQDVIKSDNIHGIASANVSFEAPFDLRGGVVSNGIVSTIGIQIDDGRLSGVSTFKMITESLRTSGTRLMIGKENINELERKLNDLHFQHLENTLLIRNGVLTIPSMSISSSALDVEVSGKHTFTNQIDYRFGFRLRDLKKKEQSEFGTIIDDGTGVRVFVRMYGDLSNPTIEWDKTARKEQAMENRALEKETIKSMWKSEFGMFKNDTTVKEYIKDRTPKEELIIEFNPTDSIDELYEQKLPKRENKFVKKLKKFGESLKEEEKDEIEIEY